MILIDNVGYGDIGCYGNRVIRTPNMDRLARQGVRCTDFYVGSPSCMPSRGALLTGRHPERNGLNEQIWRIDEMLSQPAAGPFVGFVIGEAGEDVVRDLYRASTRRPDAAGDLLESALGDSIDGIERRWMSFIEAGSGAPDEDTAVPLTVPQADR